MEKAGRRLYAWLAFFAIVGLVFSLILNLFNVDPIKVTDLTLFHQNTAPIRFAGFFSYFTIWSNILVVYIGTSIARGRPPSKYFDTLFATGLIMITITGLVYNTFLLPAYPPKGWFWLTSALMHLVAPVMYIYLWITKGPRGCVDNKRTLQILMIPIIYLGYTVIRGLAIKQWPYKFLDLTSAGLLLWSISVAVLFGFGIALIFTFARLDKKAIKQLR